MPVDWFRTFALMTAWYAGAVALVLAADWLFAKLCPLRADEVVVLVNAPEGTR